MSIMKLSKQKRRQRKLGSTSCRVRKTCPSETCGAQVIHLPRHLQDVHGWSKEHARTAVIRFGMRKKYAFTEPGKAPKKKKNTEDKNVVIGSKRKDYHHYHYCPIHGCMALVKRMPPHLKQVHKLQPGSHEYISALSRVWGPVRESNMAPYHKRPQKSTSVIALEDDVADAMEESTDQNETDDNISLDESSNFDFSSAAARFEAWLKPADGGNLDETTSKQHRAQIVKILKVIDSGQVLTSLFDERLINETFLEGYAKKKYYPKATKSYLMSLRHFYSCCLRESSRCDISITAENILALKEKVTRWSSSLRKGCSRRH